MKKRDYEDNGNEWNNDKKIKTLGVDDFPKIKIIVLRLPEDDDTFITTEIEQKIEWIANEINEKCKILQENSSDSLWIFDLALI